MWLHIKCFKDLLFTTTDLHLPLSGSRAALRLVLSKKLNIYSEKHSTAWQIFLYYTISSCFHTKNWGNEEQKETHVEYVFVMKWASVTRPRSLYYAQANSIHAWTASSKGNCANSKHECNGMIRPVFRSVWGRSVLIFFFLQMELQTGYLKVPLHFPLVSQTASPAPNSTHWLIVSDLLKQIEQCF